MKHETLLLFKQDLWKDQRQLEVRDGCIIKSFHTQHEALLEVSLLRSLEANLKIACVPHVIDSNEVSATYSYTKGIRLFNLFVELDCLPPHLQEAGRKIKHDLLHDANLRQAEIQRALTMFQEPNTARPYPVSAKLRIIVQVLADALGISVDWTALDSEIDFLSSKWEQYACVPFRDASTKNMLLETEYLWLGNFESEKHRAAYIAESIETNRAKWTANRIIDFDFSSCTELSTPEDDPISLNFSERTWSGMPDDGPPLCWNGSVDRTRAAITFIVRYYRFGGRKAAYRLLHPSGHRTRFRHDSDMFYFQRLPAIVLSLWPEARTHLPGILGFTDIVARSLGTMRSPIDLFLEAGLGEKRIYYVDVFPE